MKYKKKIYYLINIDLIELKVFLGHLIFTFIFN